MSEKKAISEIMEEVRSNHDVVKALRGKEAPNTREEAVAVWANAAAGLGYSLSEEDILNYFSEYEQAR